MDLREAASTFGIPSKVIARMEKEGLICLPLDDGSMRALSVLSQLWGKKWFVAESLKSVRSSKERTLLLLFPDYDKVDRYILNTFLGECTGNTVATEVLRYRVKRAFAMDVDVEKIRRLRQTAYDIKRRKVKLALGKMSLDYAEILGV